jgi:hypothetical protein
MERPRRLYLYLVLALAASLVLLACPNDPPPDPGTVATPTFSIPGGLYNGPQTVAINCGTIGAQIRYTVDGSDPSPSHGTIYVASINVNDDMTIKAIAYASDMEDSAIAEAVYDIDITLTKVPTPEFHRYTAILPSGVYTSTLTDIELYSTLGNPSFVYTTDGTVPSHTLPNGTIWAGGYLTVSRKTTLKLMAYFGGMTDSDIAEAFYDVFSTPTSLGTTYSGYNAMTVDAAGHYHVAWLGTGPTIKYSTNASGSWVTETALTPATGWQWLSIAVSSLGDVYIAGFKQDIVSDLLCVTKPHPTVEEPAPVWAAPAAIDDSVNVVGQYVSMAIDSNDYLHAAYYDANLTDLKYATNATGSWLSTVIDSDATNDVGTYCSLAIDSSNKVHVSYFDATNGNLKYVTNKSGGWVDYTEDADVADTVGKWSAIDVDGSGKVHISYYDETNQDLKYATNASGSWEAETIDATGKTGLQTSIALDTDGGIRICYFSEGAAFPYPQSLWYAIKVKPADTTWLTQEMRANLTGQIQYAHLVADGSGYAGILSGVTFTKDGP